MSPIEQGKRPAQRAARLAVGKERVELVLHVPHALFGVIAGRSLRICVERWVTVRGGTASENEGEKDKSDHGAAYRRRTIRPIERR